MRKLNQRQLDQFKGIILYLVGGFSYVMIELIWRGRSHWTMFLLGGICFSLIGLINEVFPWEMALWKQQFISTVIVTIAEFICGVIVNLKLGWDVWDYSTLPFNCMGQICLPFSILWFFLSLSAIFLDDCLRWMWFNEEKPHYKLF